MTQQYLDDTNINTGFQQVSGEGMTTGIITLLTNRSFIKSTIVITQTTVSRLKSCDVCDDSTIPLS